jgi:hypothetical protein
MATPGTRSRVALGAGWHSEQGGTRSRVALGAGWHSEQGGTRSRVALGAGWHLRVPFYSLYRGLILSASIIYLVVAQGSIIDGSIAETISIFLEPTTIFK